MSYSFPESVGCYQRSDAGSLTLREKRGRALPPDLRGFVYVVAPTGRHNEGPGRRGVTPFLNGDGTVYRIALEGAPRLDWALAKPPCHWAELATEIDPRHRRMRMRDWGITRLSDDLGVGGRNLLNTAFQAVRFGADPAERLVLTYESGRPFEIDPHTLEVITPIGRSALWRATMLGGTPFEVVAATSHPAFDPDRDARGNPGDGVLFMVNYTRDVSLYVGRMLRLLGLAWQVARAPRRREAWRRAREEGPPLDLHALTATLRRAIRSARRRLARLAPEVDEVGAGSAQLIFWDGAREPAAVELEDAHGRPLQLVESAHQMAVTEHYVVIADAAFKFEMDLVIPYLEDVLPGVPDWMIRWVRERLSRIQPQQTRVHLVPRSELIPGRRARVKTVVLRETSSVHYFADHDDDGGRRVVLHVVDNAATDSSEFLLKSDRAVFPPGAPLAERVLGMMPCAMDVDRIARWEIDVASGRARRVLDDHGDRDTMWTVALATGPDVFRARATARHEHLWFYTHGLLPDAISELVWRLYAEGGDYRRRMVPMREVEARARAGGIAPRLCRYDVASHSVVDSFEVPKGWLVLSPQFVPMAGKSAPEGYLVATAFGPREEDKEIWVFRADALAAGPVLELRGEDAVLPWGYTLHTTWLERAARRTGGYRVPIEDDLPLRPGTEEARLVIEHVIPNAYR